MSQKINDNLYDLRRFQSIISKKILKKFGIDYSTSGNGWGWFVDPELDYNNKFNKNKYATLKHISIPNTIQEYPRIRSIKSINNFHNNFRNNLEVEMDNKSTNTRETNYINIVGVATLLSLIYILIIL